MEWANQPTIGTNAGGTTYNNHVLTGVNYAFYIGCVHTELLNDTNNVVYDLVPNPGNVMSSQANPPYHTTIGRVMCLIAKSYFMEQTICRILCCS